MRAIDDSRGVIQLKLQVAGSTDWFVLTFCAPPPLPQEHPIHQEWSRELHAWAAKVASLIPS